MRSPFSECRTGIGNGWERNIGACITETATNRANEQAVVGTTHSTAEAPALKGSHGRTLQLKPGGRTTIAALRSKLCVQTIAPSVLRRLVC